MPHSRASLRVAGPAGTTASSPAGVDTVGLDGVAGFSCGVVAGVGAAVFAGVVAAAGVFGSSWAAGTGALAAGGADAGLPLAPSMVKRVCPVSTLSPFLTKIWA